MIYFYSKDKSKAENQKRKEEMQHNSTTFSLIRDVALAGTACIGLGFAVHKVYKACEK